MNIQKNDDQCIFYNICKALKGKQNDVTYLRKLLDDKDFIQNFLKQENIFISETAVKKVVYQILRQKVFDDVYKQLKTAIVKINFDNFCVLVDDLSTQQFRELIFSTWKFLNVQNKIKVMESINQNQQRFIDFDKILAQSKDIQIKDTLKKLDDVTKKQSKEIVNIFEQEFKEQKKLIDQDIQKLGFFQRVGKKLMSNPYGDLQKKLEDIKIFIAFQNKTKFERIFVKLTYFKCQQILGDVTNNYTMQIYEDMKSRIRHKVTREFKRCKETWYLMQKRQIDSNCDKFKLLQDEKVVQFLKKNPTLQDTKDELVVHKIQIEEYLKLITNGIFIYDEFLYVEFKKYLYQRYACIIDQQREAIHDQNVQFDENQKFEKQYLNDQNVEHINDFLEVFINKSFQKYWELPPLMVSKGYQQIQEFIQHLRMSFKNVLDVQNIKMFNETQNYILENKNYCKYFQELQDNDDKYIFIKEFINVLNKHITIDYFIYSLEGLKYFINNITDRHYVYRLWFQFIKMDNTQNDFETKVLQTLQKTLIANNFDYLFKLENLSFHKKFQTQEMFLSISGFLSESSDKNNDWKSISYNFPFVEHYSLSWQSYDRQQLITDIFSMNNRRVSPLTQVISNVSNMVLGNNKFLQHQQIAIETGQQLGFLTHSKKLFHNKLINIISFSLGTEVAYQYLMHLSSMVNQNVLIKNVVLIGSCIRKNEFEDNVWQLIGSRNLVHGKIYVICSINDKVLQYLFQVATFKQALGYKGYDSKRVAQNLQKNDTYFNQWTYLENMSI